MKAENKNRLATSPLIIVGGLMLIAFALRVYRLDFVSLRGDEAFTVVFVQRTWEGLWKGISTVEPNPPLLYLALRVWVALAGASEFVTRYFSVFFGVLGVPLMYRLAHEMFADSVIAFLAAALIAINPYQIWHSQDVRNYTMWPTLSVFALVFFWRWWKAEERPSAISHQPLNKRFAFYDLRFTSLLFYTLATLTSLYTHYYDTFLLVALNVFVFGFTLWERRWKTLARWITVQATLVLLYAPWVLFGTNRITTYGEASAEKSVPLLDQFSRTIATFVVSDTVTDTLKTVVWLPLAIALVAVLVYLARQNLKRAAFLFLWILVPTLALFAISLSRPLFLERYLNGIAPAYYLAFAIGIAALWQWPSKWKMIPVALAILFFVGASTNALANHYFDPAYAKAPNWRALMQYIKDHREPGDFVIQNFTEMSPLYYLGRDLPLTTLPQDFWARPSDEKTLNQLNKDYRRIWFIPAQPDWWDDGRFVEKFLARNDERILDQPLDAFRLQLYLTPREFESKIIPVNARVGNATLIGYRVEGTRAVRVTLLWRTTTTQKIEKDLAVFAHLTDANNAVLAQHDGAPAFGLYPTSVWQSGETIVDVHTLQVDAAPGKYSLIVGMYDPTTLNRVPVFDAKGIRQPDDHVQLTQITINQ